MLGCSSGTPEINHFWGFAMGRQTQVRVKHPLRTFVPIGMEGPVKDVHLL